MKSQKKRGIIFKILKFFGILFFAVLILALSLFVWVAKDLPRPEKFTERELAQTTTIYDRTGKVILYTIFGEEKRTYVSLENIPLKLQQAILVMEDSRFYQHFGLDFKGILRSLWLNFKIKDIVYGGSTISQQLIRSTFLPHEKTLFRKIREVILTLELERRYSKDQILEWYLNQVPFGNNAYGVEAASQTYFGKPVSQLELPQMAILAALIKAPSYYSPYGQNTKELFERKNLVLDRMAQEKYITLKEAQEAKEAKITFAKNVTPIKAPHFTLYVKDLLEKMYGQEFLKTKGLNVITTLDWELQQTAEKIVKKWANQNITFRAYNAALVALEPSSGDILAMVGSKDWFGEPFPKNCIPGQNCLFDPQFNVATSLPGRQPGSAFKPIVYAVAFEKGYTDKTIVVDEPTNFGIWGGKPYIPKNYDGRFRGPVTLRQALAQSLNVPSVKVLAYLAGLQDSIKMAKEMGITTLTQPPSFYGLSLVLGGGEVKLLDLVTAYGVFANQGAFVPYRAILKIQDQKGTVYFEAKKPAPKQIISSSTANLISDILSDNIARSPIFGLNSPLYIPDFKVAVKTGTTTEFRDNWTIGYTPSLVVGVWTGNNDNSPNSGEPGVRTAAPLWREFFLEASKKYLPKSFN